MLATLEQLQAVPGLGDQNGDFLTGILFGASQAVVSYLKRDIEQKSYTEFYSGDDTREIVLRQYPVQSITNLWFDPNGYFGQGNSFGVKTLLTQGTNYVLEIDSGGTVSNRGLVMRIGGSGGSWIGFYPELFYSGKLSAYKLPVWPRGDGNLKVSYTAGYAPGQIPADIVQATVMLVTWYAANLPSGSPLSGEGLGSYSYSVLSVALGTSPVLGSIPRTLAPYREPSF